MAESSSRLVATKLFLELIIRRLDNLRYSIAMPDDNSNSIPAVEIALFHAFAHRTDEFHSVAWSPDGKMIATGSSDRLVRVWEAGSS
jgi:WD40 repeat protein